jgi:hypothetical protein
MLAALRAAGQSGVADTPRLPPPALTPSTTDTTIAARVLTRPVSSCHRPDEGLMCQAFVDLEGLRQVIPAVLGEVLPHEPEVFRDITWWAPWGSNPQPAD